MTAKGAALPRNVKQQPVIPSLKGEESNEWRLKKPDYYPAGILSGDCSP
jgi:hypothetical protein